MGTVPFAGPSRAGLETAPVLADRTLPAPYPPYKMICPAAQRPPGSSSQWTPSWKEMDSPELVSSAPGALRSAKLPALHTVVAIQGGPAAGVFSLADFFACGTCVDTAELAAAQRVVQPGDTCYILYTSGSTAAPKGVTLALTIRAGSRLQAHR
jgi:acyl-CoA synthetase (AMP-forming)/AMP-acid ligase II